MDKKMTGIVAYITWFGLIIALVAGDKEGAKFHINLCLVCWVMGLIYAIKEEEKEVPLIGKIKLLK